MLGWFHKILDGLKGAAAVRFIAPLIKSLTPWIVTACVYIGVDPELANTFAESAVAVAIVAIAFVIDLALTFARTKTQLK